MTNKYDIIWLDKVDSTNTEAKKRISVIDNLSVLSAFEQSAGRGQRGNSWHAKPGENLTFSIILKFGEFNSPPFQAYDQFAISQMAALSVVDFLALHNIEAHIKWPNDIYIGNKKICGMLIENSLKSDLMSSSIIGIGINVNQLEFDAPNPTSMSLETGDKFDIRHLLDEFIEIFEGYRSRYLHINGGLGKLRYLYLSQMWRLNEETLFVDYTGLNKGHLESPMNICSAVEDANGRPFKGIIRGLSDTGLLIVEEDGKTKEYGFKEIGWVIEP